MKRSVYVWLGLLVIALACLSLASHLGQGTAAPQKADPWMVSAGDDPILYFSDLTSGPKSGNSDTSGGRSGQDGAIVTLWGRNLGSSQGSSKVYSNGAEAASYYSWENATTPVDLYSYHQMQKISFQVSHLAQDGSGSMYVVVNGKTSNTLPFTVRAGNIYFSMTSGNDDTGDGSWGTPWQTIQKAVDSLGAGDIAYIGDGVDQTTQGDFDAVVNLGSDGTADNPKALIVYPGATSNVGNPTTYRAFWYWNTETGSYSMYWVVAGFRVTTGAVGIPVNTGTRVIGNYITAPQGDGMDGAIDIFGSDVYILGNELTEVGAADCSKLYHTIYAKGVRQDDPPRAPTESNREIAWNYLHDNMADRGINIYSEQEYSAFIEQHRVHDNVIVNQHGDGIMLGYYVTGDNWVYNNLIVNAGAGPEWGDDASYHTGIRINTGHEEVTQTRVYIYNNTLYGNGWSGAVYSEETGSLLFDPGALTRSTSIYFSNNVIFSTGEPYLADESTSLEAGDYLNCWYGDGTAPAWDTTGIDDDPLFVNMGGFDFRLQDGSPCMDKGKNLASVVARDLLGVPRPQGLAFDLGVYEFITGTVTIQQGVYLPLVMQEVKSVSTPTPTHTATPTNSVPMPSITPTPTSTATPTVTIPPAGAIIADHTHTDLGLIPESWINQVKANLRIFYGHTSHGSQPISGMLVLMNDPSANHLYDFTTDGSVVAGMLSVDDHYGDMGDLGGYGDTDWADLTRTYLDGPGSDRNVVIWSWCGGVSDNSPEGIDTYLNAMDQLEQDYPDVTFIYMTGHLDGTGADGNLNVRNDQIRDYVLANDKVLFDFANIESYDPDGEEFMSRLATDGCYYDADGDGDPWNDTANWAIEWCDANSGSPLCSPCDDCAHSESLNCNLKARAFWWLLARIAGWDGNP
jgi:hypothetical protein